MAMTPLQSAMRKNTFYFSIILHFIILAIFIISFDFSAPMPVVENSKNKEVINAVVMNAVPHPTKILQKPVESVPVLPAPPKAVEPEPAQPKVKPQVMPVTKPTIALADKKQKKIKEDLIQKQLLSDLKKQTEQQKKNKTKNNSSRI